MQRRTFLHTASLATLGTMLSCSNEMKSAIETTPYLDNLGIQLWTVREQLQKDPLATLKAIKANDYKQVELMRLDQLDQLGPMCKDLGLDIKCAHFDWKVITEQWGEKDKDDPSASFDPMIEKALKNNMSHLVFAYWLPNERASLEDYRVVADRFNIVGEKCNSAGINFGYHNHSFEFIDFDGTNGFDILLDRVDNDKMKYELDVFWASIAGIDPVALMNDMKDRINLLHLKDRAKESPIEFDESKVAPDTFKELGNGMVDLKSVLQAANKYNIDYCHVEQDQSPDVLKSIATSQKYLTNLEV